MSVTLGDNYNVSLGDTIRTYLALMKLRIVALLCFTTLTAMFVASNGRPDFVTVVFTMIGGIFASGGSSAINQYLDRDMDILMKRTAKRPIPSGRLAPINALMFGIGLIAWSVAILATFVNPLTAFLAFCGSIYYVVIYTIMLKRNTVVNILIGGGAGAIPMLVGWAAITNSVGFEAWILFAIVFYWTPPHSWALALLVNNDYTAAKVPMMPAARGEKATTVQIVLYSAQLFLISLLPSLFGVFGWIYTLIAVLYGAHQIRLSILLMQQGGKDLARRTFKYSTLYLAVICLAMMIDSILI